MNTHNMMMSVQHRSRFVAAVLLMSVVIVTAGGARTAYAQSESAQTTRGYNAPSGSGALGPVVYAATNEVWLHFQNSCSSGISLAATGIAFAGIQKHNPSISETLRRSLNSKILGALGGGLRPPTELSALSLLAPFLQNDNKGREEMEKAERRIKESPLIVEAQVRRPAIDTLSLQLRFVDRRPGCQNSTLRNFQLKLPNLEAYDSPGLETDSDVHELSGFFHRALAESASALTGASRVLIETRFEMTGNCELRGNVRRPFESQYQQLKAEVGNLVSETKLPQLADQEVFSAGHKLPEGSVLMRIHFTPSNLSERLVAATVEVVLNDAKAYVLHANAVVDQSQLKGCATRTSAQERDTPAVSIAGSMETLLDCADCPQMVIVPSGTFMMGSETSEKGRSEDEGPQTRVSVRRMAVSRFEISVGQFQAFIASMGHQPAAMTGNDASWCAAPTGTNRFTRSKNRNHKAPGFSQTDTHPVVCVSWHDAKAFADWLSAKTRKKYRLLTEAEFEYVARAGTRSPYWWGEGINPSRANYETSPGQTSQGAPGTARIDSFNANPWGLYHINGNAAEWVEDCWNNRHPAEPTNAEARTTGDCQSRAIRGGGWTYKPDAVRSAARDHAGSHETFVDVGFRVARELDP